ncbi:MAG: aspartyl-phosphate phosphatase Spo0E family protein [Dehalobacterium sp.]
MESLKRLFDNIEEVRGLLNKSAEVRRGLTDLEIVYISQQLDSLLNDYYRMKMSNMSNKRKNYKELRVI